MLRAVAPGPMVRDDLRREHETESDAVCDLLQPVDDGALIDHFDLEPQFVAGERIEVPAD
jgi:hypothetical protein